MPLALPNGMKTPLLALLLILASVPVACARPRIYSGGYYAPPPPPVGYYRAPAPRSGYVWIDGYWNLNGPRYAWRNGYWSRPPWRGAYWVPPRYQGRRWYPGYWGR